GLRATTVRDIADAAGILSGSLYHHFDSKESMVDEILRGFQDDLFGRYHEIVAAGMGSRETFEALVVASFEAIDTRHSAVAIYQDE
ncbi:TetR/AcrR family transcriptional regulator, partial [Prescottella defluvii]